MAKDQLERAELGNLIRKCRQKRKLTLKELCDKAGVSVGYLSQVERGNATPSLGHAGADCPRAGSGA